MDGSGHAMRRLGSYRVQEAGSWRIQTTVTTSLAMNATSHLIKVVVVV